MGWRRGASDGGLFLGQVDLIAQTQSHPLRHEGYSGISLEPVVKYNTTSYITVNFTCFHAKTRQEGAWSDGSVRDCGLPSCARVHGAVAVTHLTFGSDAYVSGDGRLGAQVDGLLDADISQGIFSKDRTSVKVGSHEATEARQSLMRGNSPHMLACQDHHFLKLVFFLLKVEEKFYLKSADVHN